jgi:hypothetical protein
VAALPDLLEGLLDEVFAPDQPGDVFHGSSALRQALNFAAQVVLLCQIHVLDFY